MCSTTITVRHRQQPRRRRYLCTSLLLFLFFHFFFLLFPPSWASNVQKEKLIPFRQVGSGTVYSPLFNFVRIRRPSCCCCCFSVFFFPRHHPPIFRLRIECCAQPSFFVCSGRGKKTGSLFFLFFDSVAHLFFHLLLFFFYWSRKNCVKKVKKWVKQPWNSQATGTAAAVRLTLCNIPRWVGAVIWLTNTPREKNKKLERICHFGYIGFLLLFDRKIYFPPSAPEKKKVADVVDKICCCLQKTKK